MTQADIQPVDWTEDGALPGILTLRFEGVNSDALERIEVENFQRGLSAPQAEDPGGTAFTRGRRSAAMTPETGVGVALGFVFAGVAFAIGGSLDLATGAGFALVLGAFIFGLGIPPLVRFVLGRRGATRGAVMTETFTVEATNEAMTLRGATIGAVTVPIDDLVEVIAAPRLGWRDRSGRFKPFPCGFTLTTKNTALAGRLQQLVTQMRAMRGYRGA